MPFTHPDNGKCQESVIDHENSTVFVRETKQCPNRSRFLVTAPGWTMKMCGTHANPWRRAYRGGAYYSNHARAEVTEL